MLAVGLKNPTDLSEQVDIEKEGRIRGRQTERFQRYSTEIMNLKKQLPYSGSTPAVSLCPLMCIVNGWSLSTPSNTASKSFFVINSDLTPVEIESGLRKELT